jgi:hypothetical protein
MMSLVSRCGAKALLHTNLSAEGMTAAVVVDHSGG